jgi:Tfp pilus assembly protein PilF
VKTRFLLACFLAVTASASHASTSSLPSLPLAAAETAVDAALRNAEDALAKGDAKSSQPWIMRALERDAKSIQAWDLRARCAMALGDQDEGVYALHKVLQLSISQKRPAEELTALRARIVAADALAPEVFSLSKVFVAKLSALAEQYEKDKRPHSAIQVHKEILALDPTAVASADAIQRLASAPDPSLAGDAKPKDLLAGVSEEWIRDHDAKHATWPDRAKIEREHYITSTNSGYANLVRAAEAMEQMNAFYRQFFQYGVEGDGKTVPRIELHIFKKREEYLKLGIGPPVEWSAGHFTGDAVETYVGDGSFNDMVGTLFHEAAHQFVSLATSASGWLNEGLASFFEGCRILSNGTVIMNLPANHRLFPMVERLKVGWMTDANDGIDPAAASKSNPTKAPTFRIVLENKYEWGPPWYAPTWALVYFLYNYQDPIDGRYVYRGAFRTFIDKSGGRDGNGAVKNFEEVVLANPQPPIPGVVRPKGSADVKLAKTVADLDPVWKDWLISLAKEQNGEIEVARPYLQWARYALKNKDDSVAREHFEKALVAQPKDTAALLEFGAFLADHKETDRAAKLALDALRVLENAKPVDAKAVQTAEKQLEKWDPKRRALDSVHRDLAATAKNVVQHYYEAKRPMMVMDLAWRLGTDLNIPELFDLYAKAVRESGRTLYLWQVAYNEKSLEGWSVPGDTAFAAEGNLIRSKYKTFSETGFDFQMLTLDAVTSGDYSFETEVQADKGKVNFCGLVFGKKDANNFHALLLFPGKSNEGDRQGLSDSGFIDLASATGGTAFKTWRHNPVKTAVEHTAGATVAEVWHKLRIDISGNVVDCWYDGEFLSTQEFSSADVLRGNFGLITGPGEVKFANARFQSRPARDVGAQIERAIRMEKLMASDQPIGGSYLNRIPPFPQVDSWVQGVRRTWLDKGLVPQVFVLWSIAQNELVPIDGWLREFAARHADVGLEIVSVVSANDAEALPAYLANHAFPGALAIDGRSKPGIGDTFTRFSIDKFNLPRLLLIDIDGTVAWEGDPGFSRASPWLPGAVDTFLDAPMTSLIERSKLAEVGVWLPKWRDTAAPALARGDLATALPILDSAAELTDKVPEVAAAHAKLAAVLNALTDLPATASGFEHQGVTPALTPLLAYAPLLKKPIDKNTQILITQMADGTCAKEWANAAQRCARIKTKKTDEEKLALATELVGVLAKMKGRFPMELLADLQPAVEAADAARVQEIASAAGDRPMKWLLTQFLHW